MTHGISEERQLAFWSYVNKRPTNGCWNWAGGKSKHGYGSFFVDRNRRSARVHRVAWELLRGHIPEDLTIDHLCKNKLCVNPDHMEIVTRSINSSRGAGGQKTHCRNGHALTPDNLVKVAKRPNFRACRECTKARRRRRAKVEGWQRV